MSSLLRTDIRQSMPAYVERGGDVVYKAPYRATDADLNVIVLRADRETLQAVIDKELNRCVAGRPARPGSQKELHFECVDEWIVFIYAFFRSLASTDATDKSRGSVTAFELSTWVPIVKSQSVGGAHSSEPAWFLPLVYTAPTASVVLGREVYGYQKLPGYLTPSKDGGPPVGVQTRVAFPGASTVQFRLKSGALPPASGWDIEFESHELLPPVVKRYFGNAPLIFRKQIGLLREQPEDGGGPELNSGYTAIIEARVPITRLSSLQRLELGENALTNVPSEVLDSLGLGKDAQPEFGVAVRGCRVDAQHGREIWVAEGSAPFIHQLSAPGNALLREAGSYDVYDPKENSRRATAAEPPPNAAGFGTVNITQGVGEAYFATTRPKAIAALLSRHFPQHLNAQIRADPKRDFAVLFFLRGAVESRVHLYEFSLWIPVLHKDEPAWYVPYIFRSPGVAVVHAREWFGHPCQEAFIQFDDQNAEKDRVVFAGSPVRDGFGPVLWQRVPAVTLAKSSSATEDKTERLKALLGERKVVGLLQARHVSDTSRACVQSVVSSHSTLSARPPSSTLYRRLSLDSSAPLGYLLDLEPGYQEVSGIRLDNLTMTTSPMSPVPYLKNDVAEPVWP